MSRENGIPTLDGHDFVPGRIVTYVADEHQHFPLLLVTCQKGDGGCHWASAVMFGPWGVKYMEKVFYDQRQLLGTWHWSPSRRKAVPQPVAAAAAKMSPPAKPAGKSQPRKPLYAPRIEKPR